MKIRNNTRILALMLALVMLLPLISIPTFAEEAEDAELKPLFSENFEGSAFKNAAASNTVVDIAGTQVTATVPDLRSVTEGNNTYVKIPYSEENAALNFQLNIPALSYETTPVVVFEADYFVSSDALGPVQTQIRTYKSTEYPSGRSWFGLANFYSKDKTTSFGGRFETGVWNRVQLVLDLVKGNKTLFINGVFINTLSCGETNLTFNAGSWIIGKTDSKLGVSDSVGYLAIDNAKVYAGADILCGTELWYQNFENATKPADALNRYNNAHSIVSATENAAYFGKVVHRSLEPIADSAYYLYKDNSNVETITVTSTENGISGTATVGGVTYTVKNSTVNTLFLETPAKDESGNDIAGFYVLDGALKSTRAGGGNYASWTRATTRAFDPITAGIDVVTLSTRYYFSSDAKIPDISVRAYLTRRGDKNIEYDLCKISANGTNVSIKTAANNVTLLSGANVNVTTGGWIKLDFVLNLKTGECKVYVNDVHAFTEKDKDCTDKELTLQANFAGIAELSRSFDRGSKDSKGVITYNHVGFMEIGEASLKIGEAVATHPAAPVLPDGVIFSDDFESYFSADMVSDSAIHTSAPYASLTSNLSLVKMPDGNVALKAESQLNNNQTAIKHKELTAEEYPHLLYEFDIYIDADTKGQTQVQATTMWGKKTEDGASESQSWCDLLVINAKDEIPYLGREGGSTKYNLKRSEWHTISMVFDMANGVYDIYVDSEIALINQRTRDFLTFDKIVADTLKIAKINNSKVNGTGGAFFFDNVKLAVAPTMTVPGILDYEAFENGLLESVTGASIRLKTPAGLRFASKVDTDKVAVLEKLVEAGKIASYNMGTLITPASYVEAAGEFSKQALDEKLDVTTPYLDVEFGGVYFSGDANFDAYNGSYLVGSVVNIRDENIDRTFAGGAYIEIHLNDGTTVSIYAEAQERSVRQVADLALEDEDANWNDDQLDVLNKYATPKA